MQEPDPKTVRAAAAGDTAAFTEIVRSTQADVWRFIRHLVHDDELAADLTQDTYVRVHRSIGTFRGDSLFRTWLFRIARNLTIDEQRRSGRRGRSTPLDEQRPEVSGSNAGPALYTELRAALRELPEPQRSAFVVVEVFGLKYREAGAILGVSEGTVKSRVFHARARLVRWFEADSRAEGDRG